MNLSQVIVDFVESDLFHRIVYLIDSLGILYLILLWLSIQAFLRLRKRLPVMPREKSYKLAWIFAYAINGAVVYRLFSPAALIINASLFLIAIIAGCRGVYKKHYRSGAMKVILGLAQLFILVWSSSFGRTGILIADLGIFLMMVFVVIDTVAKFTEFDELEKPTETKEYSVG